MFCPDGLLLRMCNANSVKSAECLVRGLSPQHMNAILKVRFGPELNADGPMIALCIGEGIGYSS